MPEILITRNPLELSSFAAKLENHSHGAYVSFAGNVRNNSRGLRVLYLEYQAYGSMAEKQLFALARQAEERWSASCAIGHRLGRVMAGECSVVVAVSTEHRAEAFEACRWLMDTLKEAVPIWKKEFYEGGAHWIEGSEAVESPNE